jgi:ATP dependent DNA ligase domain
MSWPQALRTPWLNTREGRVSAIHANATDAGEVTLSPPGRIYKKVDGGRVLAYKDGTRVHLVSRNGVDHARRFRDLAAIAKLSGRTLVLDGEVAIFDQQLSSRFEWLRDPDPEAVGAGVERGYEGYVAKDETSVY